jgi:hypothetical protein
MRNAKYEPRVSAENRRPRAVQSINYEHIAGGLASEMAGFIQSKEPQQFCPPYNLIILSNDGAVVFDCELDKNWNACDGGSERKVRRSHFPATALLTDSAHVTRTFLIERAPHRAISG